MGGKEKKTQLTQRQININHPWWGRARWQRMKRALGTYRMINKDITFMSVEFQKERKLKK